jgi:hypothetical protein
MNAGYADDDGAAIGGRRRFPARAALKAFAVMNPIAPPDDKREEN